ncbi:hypothetical protein ACOSQ2_019526 [Xanthoceras sorbifolium]
MRSQPYKTSEDCHFDAIITHRYHINTLGIIDDALSRINDGGEMIGEFVRSCFGHFLRMDRNMLFFGVLAHELLLREIWHYGPRDEMRFRLGQHTVRFSWVEFCLITGLKFGQVLNTSVYVDVLGGIHSRIFERRADVKVKDVKDRLELGHHAAIPQNTLKISLILMLQNFLYDSDDKTSIPVWVLRLVEDLEAFNAFPWGSYIYSN